MSIEFKGLYLPPNNYNPLQTSKQFHPCFSQLPPKNQNPNGVAQSQNGLKYRPGSFPHFPGALYSFSVHLTLLTTTPQISPRKYHIAQRITGPHLTLAPCLIPPSHHGSAALQELRVNSEGAGPEAPLPVWALAHCLGSVPSSPSQTRSLVLELGCQSGHETVLISKGCQCC